MNCWSNQVILDFINAINLRPELWDVEDVNYRNRAAKKDGWQLVAEEFHISVDEAMKKFKSLRTYAKNETKRLKSGSGASKRKPWFAAEAMQFILARDVPDVGIDTENTTQSLTNKDCDDDQLDDLAREMENETPQQSWPSSSQSGPRIKKSKRIIDDETLQAAKAVLTESSHRQPRNPHSSFGDHVAMKLSTYSQHVRSEVEFNIMTVLHNADTGLYDTRCTRNWNYSLPSSSFPRGSTELSSNELQLIMGTDTNAEQSQTPQGFPSSREVSDEETYANIVADTIAEDRECENT